MARPIYTIDDVDFNGGGEGGGGFVSAGISGFPVLKLNPAPKVNIVSAFPVASVGNSVSTIGVDDVAQMPFASTVYGDDPSPENNYGVGDSAPSLYTLTQAHAADEAKPSLWWLLAALALIWMVA